MSFCDPKWRFGTSHTWNDRILTFIPTFSIYKFDSRYRLAVFDGVSDLGNSTTAGVEVCGLISCAGPELEDCNKDFPSDANVVNPIRIEALIIQRLEVDMSVRSLYLPLTMTQDGDPLNATDYGYLESGHRSSSMLLITLTKPRDDIMNFAIFGRKFDRDGEPPTAKGGANLKSPEFLLSIFVIFMVFMAS